MHVITHELMEFGHGSIKHTNRRPAGALWHYLGKRPVTRNLQLRHTKFDWCIELDLDHRPQAIQNFPA